MSAAPRMRRDVGPGSFDVRSERMVGLAGGALTVSALARSVKDLLENQFRLVRVTGEISNLTMARSGHWYFVLKDPDAQVRCVMFRSRNQYLDWEPRDGAKVEVRALVTLYEPRGEFQLNVESMQLAGRGELFEAFLRLRDRLQAEGLFEPERKRALPVHPRRIGIVTSPHAAALRDILTTLRRRNRSIPIVIYPAGVQGGRAECELVTALERALARAECDVLILARGGGSIEDLWCFNSEALARAIRGSAIPVVSGVGHETDFTIADFAADVRAPTPTAAAELVSPASADLVAQVTGLARRLSQRLRAELERQMQTLDFLQRRLVHPGRNLAAQRVALYQLVQRLTRAVHAELDHQAHRYRLALRAVQRTVPDIVAQRAALRARAYALTNATQRALLVRRNAVEKATNALRHLDPSAVLARGYSIASDAQGRIIVDARAVETGAQVRLTLARGKLLTRVEDKET
jgi:exodeoxyribonuclease VII large subunit